MNFPRAAALVLIGALWGAPCKAQSPHWLWARSAGGRGADNGSALSIDHRGNVYSTGWFIDSATFQNITMRPGKGTHFFLARYREDGSLLWVISAAGTGASFGKAVVTLGADSSVCIAGYFTGTVIVEDSVITTAGQSDIFLAKFNASGALQWITHSGGGGFDDAYSIASDREGNIYVGGYFSATAKFQDTTLTSKGKNDIVLAKYSPAGSLLWAKRYGGDGLNKAFGIAVAPSGSIAITGTYSGTVDFDGTLLHATRVSDIFIVKLSNDGSVQWAKKAGGDGYGEGDGIAIDAHENIYVTGRFSDSVDVRGIPPDCDGTGNIFITKYNRSGIRQWARCLGIAGEEGGNAIAIDSASNLYIIGGYDTDMDFGTGILVAEGNIDAFIAKFDSSGKTLWSDRLGSKGYDLGSSIALDASSNIYVSGLFSDTVSFGSDTLLGIRNSDIFVAKMGSRTSTRYITLVERATMTAFPNPAHSGVTIDYAPQYGANDITTIELITPLGITVKKLMIKNLDAQRTTFNFPLEDLPRGIYYCRITSQVGSETRMVVVQ